jgi:hypothetical protein
MREALGLLDSILVALVLGAEAIWRRTEVATGLGIQLVTTDTANELARQRLVRIGRCADAALLRSRGDQLLVGGGVPLEVEVLAAPLAPEALAALADQQGVRELTGARLDAAHQLAALALLGVESMLCADDGNVGWVRATLASREPFTFLGTGSYACCDGVGAVTLAAAPPRALFLDAPPCRPR